MQKIILVFFTVLISTFGFGQQTQFLGKKDNTVEVRNKLRIDGLKNISGDSIITTDANGNVKLIYFQPSDLSSYYTANQIDAFLATKQPIIAPGNSNQYWAGDETWQNFPTIPAAQVNSDWNSNSGVSQILNKPTIPAQFNLIAGNNVTLGGTYPNITVNATATPYTLPIASASILGGIKVGANLSVSGDGTLSAIAGTQINSDWNAVSGVSQILNKPTLFSGSYIDLTNKPVIPAQFNPIAGTNMSITGIYPNLTFNSTGSGSYVLPTASTTVLGGIKVGANLSVDANGFLNAVAGSGGSGTVTSFGFTNANGITGIVTNPTTSPILILSLGNITPTSVAASGTVTGSNLSGTNTGDNAPNSLYSGLVSNATHTGDAFGSTSLTVVGINGVLLSGLSTGILKLTGGIPSIAIASDFPLLNQNTTGTAGGLSSNISENQVTNLVTDLSNKASLTSPTFSGIVNVPTASQGVNTTQAASTAFVNAAITASVNNTTVVTSFNNRKGPVVPAANDYTFAQLASKPTTIAGYGITDFNSLGDARWSLLGHTHTFASLTSKPTTISGYGITDAFLKTTADGLYKGINWTPLVADIPNLPASKITSGTFDTARLPDTHIKIGAGLETSLKGDSLFLKPQITNFVSGSIATINSDTTNLFTANALANNIVIANPLGTPNEGQPLDMRIKDNGTSRTISFGTAFRFSTDLPAPTSTTINKTMYLTFRWNSIVGKWDLINKINNF